MMILNQICSQKCLDITKTTRKVLYSITNFFHKKNEYIKYIFPLHNII